MGGGENWYSNEGQHFILEAIVLTSLVILATIFEYFHGLLHHFIDTIGYGVVDAYKERPKPKEETELEKRSAPAHIKGGNWHLSNLFNRMNAEFMVLGFLAVCVWSCNQAEAFDAIAENLDDNPDASSLLHTCEDVHMFLFFAMLLNFVGCNLAIHSAMMLQLLFAKWAGELVGVNTAEEADAINEEVLTDPLLSWRKVRAPAILTGTLFHENPCASIHCKPILGWLRLVQYFHGSCKMAGHTIPDAFDFSRYISACLDQVLQDLVLFNPWTWAIFLIIYGLHAFLAILLEDSYIGALPSIELQLLIMCSGSPIAIYFLLKWTENGIRKMIEHSETKDFETKPGFLDSFRLEIYLTRLVQALLFLLCYQTSRLFVAKRFWAGELVVGSAWESALYLITVILIWMFVTFHLMPKFLFAMTIYYAMPPHIDEENLLTIEACSCFAHCAKAEQIDKATHFVSKLQRHMSGDVKKMQSSAKVAPDSYLSPEGLSSVGPLLTDDSSELSGKSFRLTPIENPPASP